MWPAVLLMAAVASSQPPPTAAPVSTVRVAPTSAAVLTGAGPVGPVTPRRRLPLPPKVCDVIAHGARGDNHTDDTNAFVAAIAACSGAAPTGRGTVIAPAPGRYLLKPLQFQSNVELRIETGATLVLWGDLASYPNYTAAYVRPGGQIPEAGCFNNPTGEFGCVSRGCKQGPLQIPRSMLWGENVTNVAIGGGGKIDGQGLAWWEKSWWKRHDLNMYWRPKLLEFPGATDLTIGGPLGLTLINSPMWNTGDECSNKNDEGILIKNDEFCIKITDFGAALHINKRLRVVNVTVHSPSEWINTGDFSAIPIGVFRYVECGIHP